MFNMTPIARPKQNIVLKQEHLNPGGSHKSRAARRIISDALASGSISTGGKRRILEKSGGNFGIGLALEAAKHNIDVDLVIGLSFSPTKKKICRALGANLVGTDLLEAGLQPKEVIEKLLNSEKNKYFFTDQFSNPTSYTAHLEETGPELASQIEYLAPQFDGLSLVLSAGTGAHAAAIFTSIKRQYKDLKLIVVEPEGCSFKKGIFKDHGQFGSAVGSTPPFLDLRKVDLFQKVSDQSARYGQIQLMHDLGTFPGPTSGANYFAAMQEAKLHPNRLVVSMTYDHGEAYL